MDKKGENVSLDLDFDTILDDLYGEVSGKEKVDNEQCLTNCLNENDLDLNLRIIAGSVTVKLAELLEIEPGCFFEFDLASNNKVDLEVENQKIAEGVLCVNEGTLGIEITKLLYD